MNGSWTTTPQSGTVPMVVFDESLKVWNWFEPESGTIQPTIGSASSPPPMPIIMVFGGGAGAGGGGGAATIGGGASTSSSSSSGGLRMRMKATAPTAAS